VHLRVTLDEQRLHRAELALGEALQCGHATSSAGANPGPASRSSQRCWPKVEER
jgi:hypothetical protein